MYPVCKHGHKLSPDNLYSYTRNGYINEFCKKCNAINTRKYRIADPEKHRMYVLNYRTKNHTAIKERDNKRSYLKEKNALNKYPQKFKARSLTKYAIKTGLLKRMPCVVCNNIFKIHAHHEDYSKPLEVVWLCVKHHAQRHRKYDRLVLGKVKP